MLQHYEGGLGIFEYDDTLWKLDYETEEALRWIGGNQQCNLPKGCISCAQMFHECKLDEGFSFGDFDTSDVVDMHYMFLFCELPRKFSLGDYFDTSNVTNMKSMFRGCRMPESFNLGDSFYTKRVTNMNGMFSCCTMSADFDLGEEFDTSNVEYMSHMFEDSAIPHGFTLGEKFLLTNCKATDNMFRRCLLPDSFTLDYTFDISNVAYPDDMFLGCHYGTANLSNCSVQGSIDILKGRDIVRSRQYDYSRLMDVPLAELAQCNAHEDLLSIVEKYCKVKEV